MEEVAHKVPGKRQCTATASQSGTGGEALSSPGKTEPAVLCNEAVLKLEALCPQGNRKLEKVSELVSDVQSKPLQTSTPEYSHEELKQDTAVFTLEAPPSENPSSGNCVQLPSVAPPAYQIPLKDRTFRDTSHSLLYPPPPPPSPGTATCPGKQTWQEQQLATASSPTLDCEDVISEGDNPPAYIRDHSALNMSNPLYISSSNECAPAVIAKDVAAITVAKPSRLPLDATPSATKPADIECADKPSASASAPAPNQGPPTGPTPHPQATAQPSYPVQYYPMQMQPPAVQSQPIVITQNAASNTQQTNMMGWPNGAWPWMTRRTQSAHYLTLSIVLLVMSCCNPALLFCAIPAFVGAIVALVAGRNDDVPDPMAMMMGGAPYPGCCWRGNPYPRTRNRLSKSINAFSLVCSISGFATCCLMSVTAVVLAIVFLFASASVL